MHYNKKTSAHKNTRLIIIIYVNYSSRFFVATTAIPASIITAAAVIAIDESLVWGSESGTFVVVSLHVQFSPQVQFAPHLQFSPQLQSPLGFVASVQGACVVGALCLS